MAIDNTVKLTSKSIRNFEKYMSKAYQNGYFTNVSRLSDRLGLEMFLPPTVDEFNANHISKFISQKFQVNSIYFMRSHSIKVFYDQ
ncbi:hypothetical protein UFOVP410_116 [uncultured Caudovirales phage]|uniref:Uncharacterized protein n=1 Tax=uncultured Caudovirales phage TaxID=2100421 RepID=A0A6J5M6Y5_9CAUD|nr:hypothetical protein UFOVP410_116 [uncultured Caudovirales phage]